MDKVRWGMIGCGAVAEKKNGPGLYKAKNSELRAVYSRSYEKAADYAKRHGVPIAYKTIDDMLADKEVDAIYIATPPESHKEYALRCLEAGKIPYIEKPMAQSHEECLEIINKAKEVNLPVYVAFYRRGMEKYAKIKEIIESGILGEIRFVQLKQFMKPEPCDLDKDNLPWRLIPSISRGGKFVDMAPHALDMTQFLFGSIIHVQGMADNFGGLYEVEDTVSAVFKFESGVIGNGMWCYVADHNEEEMLIVGDKGRISTPALSYGPVKVNINGEDQVYEYKEPEHVGQPFIQTLVNELTGMEKSPADLYSAANVNKVIDEILKEYRKRY
jgi:predicted dehydrogenase